MPGVGGKRRSMKLLAGFGWLAWCALKNRTRTAHASLTRYTLRHAHTYKTPPPQSSIKPPLSEEEKRLKAEEALRRAKERREAEERAAEKERERNRVRWGGGWAVIRGGAVAGLLRLGCCVLWLNLRISQHDAAQDNRIQ
jgi:hypothetical protein